MITETKFGVSNNNSLLDTLFGTSESKEEEVKKDDTIYSLDKLNENRKNDMFDKLSNKSKDEELVNEPVVEQEVKKDVSNLLIEKLKVSEPKESIEDESILRQKYNKLHTKHLIQSGIWQDVDGLEDLEVDDSTFEKIIELQDEQRLESKWSMIKESNEIVKAIIEHVENNKDPELIIDLWKEKQSIDNLDFTTNQGKLDNITKYYKEKAYPKWDDNKIKRHIRSLEIEGEEALDEEITFIKDEYSKYFKEETSKKVEELKTLKENEQKQKNFEIKSNYDLLKSKNVNDKEAKTLLSDMYQTVQTLQDGTELTKLDLKLLELKQNPELMLDYARYVLNPEQYKKSLTTEVKNKTVNSIWNDIKIPNTRNQSTSIKIEKNNTNDVNDLYLKLLK